MVEKKRRRMTQREKNQRAAFKKELQAEGLLPPDKKRLNRRKFAKETRAEFESQGILYSSLYEAIGWMMPCGVLHEQITPEQVGVLKVMKIAVELDRFYERLRAEGRESCTIEELCDIVKPIIEL